MLKKLSAEIARTTPAVAPRAPVALPAAPRTVTQPAPIPVEIHQPAPTALEVLKTIIGPLLQPLATTGIVIVFVVFFLLQREDLRNRFIRMAGAQDLQKTTRALDDAAQRLSRYLLMQLAINAAFGILIGAGLWLIGIPNPVLWGILAMLLRFVPYIGPIIAAVFPAALALAIDPGARLKSSPCRTCVGPYHASSLRTSRRAVEVPPRVSLLAGALTALPPRARSPRRPGTHG